MSAIALLRHLIYLLANKTSVAPSNLLHFQNQQHPCQVINAANDRHTLKKGLGRPFAMTGFCRCGGV
jgi:hypothetical protein